MKVQAEGYYSHARTDIVDMLPENPARVIEFGCGDGSTGRLVKERASVEVEYTGVELVSEMAAEASKHLERVIAADIEQQELPFEPGYFDCMIYGDVLEHLVDPWKLLERHRLLLKNDGCMVASIPNIGYYQVIRMLKKGDFRYQDSGIMDRTHLRFFTLKTIREMFEGAGLKIVETRSVYGGPGLKRYLNRMLGGIWDRQLTQQYLVRAEKA